MAVTAALGAGGLGMLTDPAATVAVIVAAAAVFVGGFVLTDHRDRRLAEEQRARAELGAAERRRRQEAQKAKLNGPAPRPVAPPAAASAATAETPTSRRQAVGEASAAAAVSRPPDVLPPAAGTRPGPELLSEEELREIERCLERLPDSRSAALVRASVPQAAAVPAVQASAPGAAEAVLPAAAGTPAREKVQWSDELVERELRSFLERRREQGRTDWPTRQEFRDAGIDRLWKAQHARGGAQRWAPKFGLTARAPAGRAAT